jgi:regulator of cell morphogenesis and NO signaling
LPGATAVFRRLKLDFCCGGQISLRQAALPERQLDVTPLLSELAALQRSDERPLPPRPANWSTTSWRATTTCIASSCPN